MHLPWIDFRYVKDRKIEVLAVTVILKNHLQKRTFIVINKSIVVKLQRIFVKFVTVKTIPSRLLIDLGYMLQTL